MKKFLFYTALICTALAVVKILYKGHVDNDNWGVLLKNGSSPEAQVVDGLVFAGTASTLYHYPKALGEFRFEDDGAVLVRSREGVEVALPIGLFMRLSADGAQGLALMGVDDALPYMRERVFGCILMNGLPLAAQREVADILSDPGELLTAIADQGASGFADLGIEVTRMSPLRSPKLNAAVQDLMSAEYMNEKELAISAGMEQVATALERAQHARLQAMVDSTVAADLIARTDSLRKHDQAILGAKRDSALFAMKYTSGYLESKRLDMVAKAIEKWDGRLAPGVDMLNAPFDRSRSGSYNETSILP